MAYNLHRARYHARELLDALPPHWIGTRKVVAGWLATLDEQIGFAEPTGPVRDLDCEIDDAEMPFRSVNPWRQLDDCGLESDIRSLSDRWEC